MSYGLPQDIKKWLEPENMIMLYASGAFPMADENSIINWYQPKVRTVIPLNNFNIPRSLKTFISGTDFVYKANINTMAIINACAQRNETWISKELISAYSKLLEFGFVKSIGVYQNSILTGGLYGISYKGAFFGESMFSKVPQASKCALAVLIKHLVKNNFSLLDVQFQTEHLKMFGAVEISWKKYQLLLDKAYKDDVVFSDEIKI
ncbi:MAG: leucyl/phenylalanyl-tRNA--protein transferase [Ignavibacteria bacterium]|nr:leucyl/phenylalanyl-tRNA--protein transferase [Ignavibacteria bacterium]